MSSQPEPLLQTRPDFRPPHDQAALVVLSAVLYALAFPPASLGALGLVAIAPLVIALDRSSLRRAGWLGLLWGTTAIWGFGYWVPVALSTYWGQPAWFGAFCAFLGSVIFMGSYGCGFAVSAMLLMRRFSGVSRALLLAAAWVAWEMARGRLLTGDPWLLLGYALGPYPVMTQIADSGAVYAVSFVAAFTGCALAELLGGRDRRRAPVLTAVVLLIGTFVYGAWRLSLALPTTPQIAVRLVQGNNDPGVHWRPELYGAGLDRYLELSRNSSDSRHPDVIVWPESAVTFFLDREPELTGRIARELSPLGSQLLLGGPHLDDRDPAIPKFFNSAFVLDANGSVTQRYDKEHLLPFGEYFPLQTIQLLRRNFERIRSFTPGSRNEALDTRLGRAAVVICFEAIFPDLVRRRMEDAEVLVNLSNDAWLGHGGGPRQHARMVAMRAIETRSWVLRATTTGVTAIIDPWGRVVAETPIDVATTLDGTVVPLRIDTIYERVGDLFGWLCVLLTAGGIGLSLLSRRAIR